MSDTFNLGDLVDRSGDPDAPMIIGVDLDGRETILSRTELDRLADAVARGLLRRGLKRGDRIGLLAANRPDYIAVTLGRCAPVSCPFQSISNFQNRRSPL